MIISGIIKIGLVYYFLVNKIVNCKKLLCKKETIFSFSTLRFYLIKIKHTILIESQLDYIRLNGLFENTYPGSYTRPTKRSFDPEKTKICRNLFCRM